MTNTIFNAYDLLEIDQNASNSEIKKAYKLKSLETHPDLHQNSYPSNFLFKMVVMAKDILLDDDLRLEHDFSIGIKVKPSPEPEVIYVNEEEPLNINWAGVISAGVIGLTIGAMVTRKMIKKLKK